MTRQVLAMIRPLLDEQGRELVPGGFVVLENVNYTPEDYQRMVHMGASFQVIRMPIGPISGWPGVAEKPEVFEQFDAMVRMVRDVGLRTVFKLVVAINETFGCERIIYAPHLYRMELPFVKAMLDDLQRQAAISKAPLLLGAWGPPTRSTTDGSPAEQARYTKVYQETVSEIDGRGIGPDLTLVHQPGATGFQILHARDASDREQAKLVRWDNKTQHVLIERWVGEARKLTLRIVPAEPG